MKRFIFAIVISGCAVLTGCDAVTTPTEDVTTDTVITQTETQYLSEESSTTANEKQLQMKIGDESVSVEWENNEAVAALLDHVENEPLKIETTNYEGFEQVGEIGISIPSDDKQLTTIPGDIVLYSDDKLVVFYGSNSWSYTKLGKITNKTESELKNMLEKENTTITLETK